MKYPLLTVTLMVSFIFCNGANGQDSEPHEVLRFIEQRLRPVVEEEYPDAAIELLPTRFEASANTRTFSVHGGSKIGRWSEEPHIETGPGFQGFIIAVAIQEGPYVGAAVVPQVLRMPYWQTFVDAAALDGDERHVKINFSFGARVPIRLQHAVMSLFQTDIDGLKPLGPERTGINPPMLHPPKDES